MGGLTFNDDNIKMHKSLMLLIKEAYEKSYIGSSSVSGYGFIDEVLFFDDKWEPITFEADISADDFINATDVKNTLDYVVKQMKKFKDS